MNFEIIIFAILYLIMDLIAAVFDFLSIGIIGPFIQFMGVLFMNIRAVIKRDKQSLKLSRQISKYISQLIPFFPTLFTIFIIETILAKLKEKNISSKKIMKKFSK